MKSYASLPLRAQEDVIEEFGVSRKYTYLLIGAGLVTLALGVLAFLATEVFARSLSSGAGVLAPLLAGAFWIGLLLLGLYIVSAGFYLRLAYQYFLTNQRVIENVGMFAQRTSSSDYGQINDIVVRQDFINRMLLGTGTIGISTPGTASEEYQLINVDYPVERRELIRDLIRSTNEGRHIDKYMIAHMMVKNGLMPTEQAALDQLDLSVGKDPAAEATFGVISPGFQRHNEEFHSAETSDVRRETSGGDQPITPSFIHSDQSVPETTVQASSPASLEQTAVSQPTSSQMQAEQTPDLATSVSRLPAGEAGLSSNSDPIPVQPAAVSQPLPPVPTPANADEGVEDLLGDGIDESDRLRAAQKKLDS